jgi:cytochrome P450
MLIDPPGDPVAAATHPDPYPFYAALVRERPIYRDEALGLWVVSSATTVAAALTNEACRVRLPAEPVLPALAGSLMGGVFRRWVRMRDDEGRGALKEKLAARLREHAPDAIAATTRRLAADRLGARPLSGDAVDRLTFELPVEIVSSLLGVPDGRLAATAASAGDFVRALAPGADAAQLARGNAAAAALAATFREDPGDDDAEAMTANAVGLLVQTRDATAGLVGNGLVALAAHPEARGRIAAEFVAEVARHDSPVQSTRRFVAAPTRIAGVALAPGDAILVLLAAANRDPAANPDPDRFEVVRTTRRSFTFGTGPHACPGERLATAIAATLLELLDATITDLPALVAGRAYRPSPNARLPRFGGKPA